MCARSHACIDPGALQQASVTPYSAPWRPPQGRRRRPQPHRCTGGREWGRRGRVRRVDVDDAAARDEIARHHIVLERRVRGADGGERRGHRVKGWPPEPTDRRHHRGRRLVLLVELDGVHAQRRVGRRGVDEPARVATPPTWPARAHAHGARELAREQTTTGHTQSLWSSEWRTLRRRDRAARGRRGTRWCPRRGAARWA